MALLHKERPPKTEYVADGTRRVFKQVSWFEAGSNKAALFYPIYKQEHTPLSRTREFKGVEALRADRTSPRKVDVDEQTR